jgi:hypothetical protein
MALLYNELGAARKKLLLEARRGIAIALISSLEWKWRKPGLAPYRPEFVGRHQLVGSIEGAKAHFDLVSRASENGGAAARTEKPPREVASLAVDRDRILGEHRTCMKERPIMLATVEAMTKTDPEGSPRCHEPDVTAQAAAGEFVHFAPPCRTINAPKAKRSTGP